MNPDLVPSFSHAPRRRLRAAEEPERVPLRGHTCDGVLYVRAEDVVVLLRRNRVLTAAETIEKALGRRL